MALVLEGKSIGSNQKTVLKGELLIWRTKNQARDQGIVISRIQFASKSKLVPRTLDHGHSSKVGPSLGYSAIKKFKPVRHRGRNCKVNLCCSQFTPLIHKNLTVTICMIKLNSVAGLQNGRVGTHGGELESPVLQSGFGFGVLQHKSVELGQQQQYNSNKSEGQLRREAFERGHKRRTWSYGNAIAK